MTVLKHILQAVNDISGFKVNADRSAIHQLNSGDHIEWAANTSGCKMDSHVMCETALWC